MLNHKSQNCRHPPFQYRIVCREISPVKVKYGLANSPKFSLKKSQILPVRQTIFIINFDFGFLGVLLYTTAVDGKDSATRRVTGTEGGVVFIRSRVSNLWTVYCGRTFFLNFALYSEYCVWRPLSDAFHSSFCTYCNHFTAVSYALFLKGTFLSRRACISEKVRKRPNTFNVA